MTSEHPIFGDPFAYAERVQRAHSILGTKADAPEPMLSARVIRQAAERSITVSFHYVLDDELGELVWEMHVDTARGCVEYRPEQDEPWEDVFARAGVLG